MRNQLTATATLFVEISGNCVKFGPKELHRVSHLDLDLWEAILRWFLEERFLRQPVCFVVNDINPPNVGPELPNAMRTKIGKSHFWVGATDHCGSRLLLNITQGWEFELGYVVFIPLNPTEAADWIQTGDRQSQASKTSAWLKKLISAMHIRLQEDSDAQPIALARVRSVVQEADQVACLGSCGEYMLRVDNGFQMHWCGPSIGSQEQITQQLSELAKRAGWTFEIA